MTTYGTIPTQSRPQTKLTVVTRAKETIQSSLSARRPWKEMVQLQSLNFPSSLSASLRRIRTNTAFFRTNYAIILLFLLFLSLLWHPISLMVFIAMMAAWMFLFFQRDDPLVLFGYTISDKIVIMFLLAATITTLVFTHVTVNILVGLSVGLVINLVHGVLRDTDDLMLIDYDEGFGSPAILRPGDGSTTVPLRNAASSSFCSS